MAAQSHDQAAKQEQESLSYQRMLESVEKIVAQVSSEDLDLDELVKKVEEGYQLIKTMRTRLEETKGKVEKLRLEYEESHPET